MKTPIFITLFLCCLNLLVSQTNSTIYGLARHNSPAAIYLATLNVNSASVTNISAAPIATNIVVTGSTMDRKNGIFYFATNNVQFMGLNMSNGNVFTNPFVFNTNGTYFDSFHYNCKDSTIYGLARKSSPPELYLAKINPATGSVTNISTSSLAPGMNANNSAFDYINNKYYFISGGKLMEVDITTGALTNTATITNVNGTYFDGMQFNAADTTIYGIARKNSPPECYLAKINPTTGVVSNISASSTSTIINLTGTTIDPVNNLFYFQGYNNLITLNLANGAVISNSVLSNVNALYFDLFEYYTFCGEENVITGLKEIETNTSFIYPNPNNGNFCFKNINPESCLTIYNMLGAVVYFKSIIVENEVVETDLPSGIYYYTISSKGKIGNKGKVSVY